MKGLKQFIREAIGYLLIILVGWFVLMGMFGPSPWPEDTPAHVQCEVKFDC